MLITTSSVLNPTGHLSAPDSNTNSSILLGYLRTEAVDCASAVAKVEHLLTQEERERRSRLKVVEGQQRMILVRWLVRQMLTQQSGIAIENWSFEYSPTGKPTAIGVSANSSDGEWRDSPIRWQITLSHCDTLLVAAVHPHLSIGIDVESKDRKLSEGIIEFACTVAEQQQLYALPRQQHDTAMLQVWTVKEAVAKSCDRVGLANLTKISAAQMQRGESGLFLSEVWQQVDWGEQRFAVRAIEEEPNHFCTLSIDSNSMAYDSKSTIELPSVATFDLTTQIENLD